MQSKHKMNKISGYYEGPAGVFYDFKHDKIFELIHCGAEILRRDVGIVGKFYQHNRSITDFKRKTDNTALTGMSNVIRLGEL